MQRLDTPAHAAGASAGCARNTPLVRTDCATTLPPNRATAAEAIVCRSITAEDEGPR